MLKPKKKITRHELKEDKLVTVSLQAKTYVEENYKQVVGVVFGVFAVLVIIIAWNYLKSISSEEASGMLGVAQIEFNNLNYDKATTLLEKLIAEYGSTDEASQGRFLLANIYFQQNKFDLAMKNYEEFISSYSGSSILLASADAGIAACQEAQKQYAEAAEMYEKAANRSPEFPESDNYRYLAGLCWEKAGNVDKAKATFEEVVNNSKTQKRVDDAKAQLIILAAK